MCKFNYMIHSRIYVSLQYQFIKFILNFLLTCHKAAPQILHKFANQFISNIFELNIKSILQTLFQSVLFKYILSNHFYIFVFMIFLILINLLIIVHSQVINSFKFYGQVMIIYFLCYCAADQLNEYNQQIQNTIQSEIMNKEDPQTVVSTLTANFHQGENNQVEFMHSIQIEPQVIINSPEQQDFQKVHQEYMAQKQTRKKEFEKRKREEFGASSSEQDDVGGSESDSDTGRRQSTMEQEKRFRESLKIREARFLEKEKQEKCQIYFSIKKLKEVWSLESLNFQEQSILISQKPYFLKQFHKIKLIHGICVADCHRIKLSTIDQNQIFIAASCKNYQGLPLNYFIFAFIVQQKLLNMGKKLYKCSPANVPGIPETLVKNSYNFGKIFKKSQILGKWQERLIVINRDGIFSYKKFNDKHSMFISGSSVKQIWTRFEIEEGLLVIKILHSSSTKTEFGIPLTQTLDKKCWLFSFYLLAFPQ